MSPSTAIVSGFVVLLTCLHLVCAEPKVVKLDIAGRPKETLRKRETYGVTIGNAFSHGLYYVNASVGTPPQTVQLLIDTGSSDVWMFGPNLENCQECLGGIYDPSKSSTYSLLAQDSFSINYVTPNSGVVGDYISDTFALGQLKISNLTMAVATQSNAVTTGIMGIGFDTDESIVSNDDDDPYPNMIDVMQQQGLINTRAYSLYLDDLEASTGAILFGGYDTAKYTGDLTLLDIQPDAETGTLSTFTVVWSLLAVTDASGTTTVSGADFPLPAVLDSGTTLTIVPSDIFDELANYFGAEQNEEYGPLVDCNISTWQGSVDYQFGSEDGPIISVPFSELAIELFNAKGKQLQFKSGRPACQFGFDAAQEDSPILLGDTFLRSAYVLYDLDAQVIGIANSAWNVSASDIQEVGAGNSTSGGSLVSAASSAFGVSVTQTATGRADAPGVDSTASGSATDSVVQASVSTGASQISGPKTSLLGLGVHGITTTAAPTGSGTSTGSGSSSKSSAAAPIVITPPACFMGLALLGWTLAIVMGGGALMARV